MLSERAVCMVTLFSVILEVEFVEITNNLEHFLMRVEALTKNKARLGKVNYDVCDLMEKADIRGMLILSIATLGWDRTVDEVMPAILFGSEESWWNMVLSVAGVGYSGRI